MNKIKFLYDVVKTMRAKDMLQGVATLEVQKDQGQIFYVKNEFQKNLVTMQTKASIHTEINYEGTEVKHQSTTEFTKNCGGHNGFKPFHHRGGCCTGIKAKLNKIAFALRLLNDIQVAEQENKTTLITLELPEIPEEIKAVMQERMTQADSHGHGHGPHGRCCFAKELFTLESGKFSAAMTVNKDYEVEKIVITFDGIQNNETNGEHVLNVIGELELK